MGGDRGVGPDLGGSQEQLPDGIDLGGYDLSKARLDGARARGANLQSAVLNEEDLRRVDLSDTKLQSAVLTQADLREANLNGARVQSVQWSGAKVAGSHLSGVQLNADFSGTDLTGAHFTSGQLTDARFVEAQLANTTWRGATLVRVDFARAQAPRAVHRGADALEQLRWGKFGRSEVFSAAGDEPTISHRLLRRGSERCELHRSDVQQRSFPSVRAHRCGDDVPGRAQGALSGFRHGGGAPQSRYLEPLRALPELRFARDQSGRQGRRASHLGPRRPELRSLYHFDAPHGSFVQAKFLGADLVGNFTRATFQGADLRALRLRGTFVDAQTISADLSGMQAQLVNFQGTVLINAKLVRTNLRGVDLRGANLREADVTEATYLERTKTDATTTCPERGACR